MTVNANATPYLMGLGTAPTEEEGKRIVRELVERRLVACGQVLGGATSLYRWKGEIEEAKEAVLLLKTTVERWEELTKVYASLHPYEVPELIAVPIAGGHKPYLDWLSTETR